MKITDVKTKIYKWDLPQPITNGLHTYSTVSLNIIEIHTDEGITGIGLTGGVKDGEKIVKEIIEYLKTRIIGLNPLDNEMIWKLLWEPKIIGRRGITTRIIGGIDLALLEDNQEIIKLMKDNNAQASYGNSIEVNLSM